MKDQYDAFKVNGKDELKVNGKLTLGENIADNGGMKIDYLGYGNLRPLSSALPGKSIFRSRTEHTPFGRIKAAWFGAVHSKTSEQYAHFISCTN